jgi:hypothetical protein
LAQSHLIDMPHTARDPTGLRILSGLDEFKLPHSAQLR